MPRPHELKAFRRGAEWALAAAVGQELGVFRALAEGAATAPALAVRLELSPRGTEVLLGVLLELGLLRREDEDAFALTGQARARFIDRDAPDFEGPAMALWLTHLRRWATDLDEAIRRGGPPPEPEAEETGGAAAKEEEREGRRRFLQAMDNKDPALVRAAVESCLERLEAAAPRVLDLGGGPGTFSRAFLERGAEVVLVDRPEVLEVAAAEFGLEGLEGLELRSADFLADFPEGPFDLVFLANISHIYGPETNAELIRQAAGALRPGGVVALLDFVRELSPFASLFAITMLLHTEEGRTYDRARYEGWIRAAGLEGTRLTRLDEDRQLITARKPVEER